MYTSIHLYLDGIADITFSIRRSKFWAFVNRSSHPSKKINPVPPRNNIVLYRLKLVRTLLNYRVLGTSTTVIFLSNDHFLYAPIYLEWTSCLISFVWGHSTCEERGESDKIQNETVLPTAGLEPTTLKFEDWCSTDCASRSWWELYYFNDLITYMYFRYQCIHWFKFENDEGERIFSCKCIVLRYILEYISILYK